MVRTEDAQGCVAPPLRMTWRGSDGNLRSRWNSESDFQRLQAAESLKRGPSNNAEQSTGGGGSAKKVCQHQSSGRVTQNGSHDGSSLPSERKWTDMPMDITAAIFSKLPVETRLFVLPFVCRAWLASCRVPTCFIDVDADEWSQGFTLYATLDFRPGPEVNSPISFRSSSFFETVVTMSVSFVTCPSLRIQFLRSLRG